MAKQIEEFQTTREGAEGPGKNNSNNLFVTTVQKTVSNDNMANGMGLGQPSELKPFEDVPGVEAIEQRALKEREWARYNNLVAAGAMGQKQVITNEGIRLSGFSSEPDGKDAGMGTNEQSQ